MPPNLTKVMTDTGVVLRVENGPRVRGETQKIPTPSTPFKCRIDPVKGVKTPGMNRQQIEGTHLLISLLTDTSGAPVDIREQDVIEVTKGFGFAEEGGKFRVSGSVQKPRDLKQEILVVVPVKRLEEF